MVSYNRFSQGIKAIVFAVKFNVLGMTPAYRAYDMRKPIFVNLSLILKRDAYD